jgi:hypothetical protein
MNKVKDNDFSYEQFEVESISDKIRFDICLKLYNTYNNIVELENALTEEALNKIKKIS